MAEGLPRGWYVDGIEDPHEADAIRRAEAEEGVLTGEELFELITNSAEESEQKSSL